ncbi:quinohemoprotein amine dehydrogenase subunit beta [Zestomonas thermotolerans]|uniref:quinohemoprotein amine dehydrogenase subunit beta n=1 Tax=Zestomonas thermotolerans TaxID=157784 RepID=UPI0023EFBBFF|nr:quinohemoprotein amine dehydrogenase subunit beta [Pseudomonas thermotolerans]MBO2511611.1 quinohemoprotein amine dehydrogenase subunit beta [Gammaproteobacteria bacterium]
MNNKNRFALVSTLALLAALQAHADTSGKALVKGHEYMAVTNTPNNLHLIDLKTESVYKTCEMPDRFGPGTLFISPDKTRAYVLNNNYRDIYGVELDTCKQVFHARLAQKAGEDARSMFSFTVSADGKELYAVANPMQRAIDHYVVGEPRMQVYSTDAGLDAKPLRSFPVPRQSYVMQAADDGSLYLAGPDIYKIDPKTGERTVALASRNWQRPGYSAPDVLYFWPHQQPNRDFTLLYTAARFADEKQDPETAEYLYGYMNINLKTGKTEVRDFAPLTELYFTGLRSPKDPNLMYGVLNRLTKYDIAKQQLIKAQELDHSYYCIAFNHAGDKVYLAGTFNDIGIHDAESLEKIGSIKLPGGDMAVSTTQVFIR